MNRIYLLYYFQLPILATKFKNRREVFNKIVKFQKKDFYAICNFSHEYQRINEIEGNTIIKSDLEIIYKEHKIEERCELFEFNGLKNIDINYSLRNYVVNSRKSYETLVLSLTDRVEFSINLKNGDREITNDFYRILPNKKVELLNEIANILDSDKEKFEVF